MLHESALVLTPRRWLAGAFLLAATLVLFTVQAAATHLVDQRFTVWGQVTDADGKPVPDKRVAIIVAEGYSIERVSTNADGWYRKVLAVSDKDRGKVFDVRLGERKVQVTVEFDPEDHETERGERVDFILP